MAYNTKTLLTDQFGKPIPQYYDKSTDQYLPLNDIKDVTFQDVVSIIGNGTLLTVGASKTLTLEIIGTSASRTINFEASSVSGAYYPIQGVKIQDLSMASSTTGTDEVWQFDVTGLTTFRARVSSLVGIVEVASLAISSAPTVAGNVTVTLNGVAANVAVTTGTAEVDTLTVTGAAIATGNITVTLNGVGTTVAVTASDTVGAIGDKIRATTFTGWTVGGTAGTAVVTFTKTTVGTNITPTFTAGTTGTTATVTATTAGVVADTSTTVATKIRGTSYSGWTTGGTGTTVTFTSATDGAKTDATYSAGTTNASGAMTTTTQGSTPSLTVKGKAVA